MIIYSHNSLLISKSSYGKMLPLNRSDLFYWKWCRSLKCDTLFLKNFIHAYNVFSLYSPNVRPPNSKAVLIPSPSNFMSFLVFITHKVQLVLLMVYFRRWDFCFCEVLSHWQINKNAYNIFWSSFPLPISSQILPTSLYSTPHLLLLSLSL